MLHERILVLVQYVTDVIAGDSLPECARYLVDDSSGQATRDHFALRSLSALMASLPATENPGFREEFDKVYP